MRIWRREESRLYNAHGVSASRTEEHLLVVHRLCLERNDDLIELFKSTNELSFLHALKNTAIYTLVSVPLGLVLGYMLATFLCAKVQGNKFLLVLYYRD